jgi:methylmalonyl-CoA mutase
VAIGSNETERIQSPLMSMTPAPTGNLNDELRDRIATWRKTVEAELKGVPFDKKLVTRTPEGVAINPLYTRIDLAGISSVETVPGRPPFVRGVKSFGYKSSTWEVAQEIAAETPAAFNRSLLSDLMTGQNSVVMPSCAYGYTEEELATALQGVELTALPVHFEAGVRADGGATLFLKLARSRGLDTRQLTGSVTLDPLAFWIRRGGLHMNVSTAFDELAVWVKQASKDAPHVRTVGVDTTPWSDAGGTAVHELAFALAAAAEVLGALAERGIEPATTATKIQCRFAIGPQFFMEIAKFRALRGLWSRLLKAYGVEPVDAMMPAVHACTGRWNKTLHDAHVNMLRVTTEALSAVLGGVESLHIAPYNEVAGETDEISRRIARNVHVLLAEEFNFTEVADAAGGSWYVEKLTDELARKAWALFQEIEASGGLCAALRTGKLQALVVKASDEKNDALDRRRSGLIGTNLFPNLAEKVPAVKVPISTGEDLSGEDKITPVLAVRAAQKFERLRAAASAYEARTGKPPQIFVARMGPVKQHKPRADFTLGFFSVGGFKAVGKAIYTDATDAAKAAAESGAPIAVLCSTDDTYPELVPVFAKTLKELAPTVTFVLAGLPAEKEAVAAFQAAGVDEFIHVRTNVREILETFLNKIGATV